MMQNTQFNVKEAYLVAKKNQAFLVISMSIHFLMTFKYYVIYSHQLLKFYVINNKGSLLEKKNLLWETRISLEKHGKYISLVK